eukprot:4002845-Prymnesium_polylepis.1
MIKAHAADTSMASQPPAADTSMAPAADATDEPHDHAAERARADHAAVRRRPGGDDAHARQLAGADEPALAGAQPDGRQALRRHRPQGGPLAGAGAQRAARRGRLRQREQALGRRRVPHPAHDRHVLLEHGHGAGVPAGRAAGQAAGQRHVRARGVHRRRRRGDPDGREPALQAVRTQPGRHVPGSLGTGGRQPRGHAEQRAGDAARGEAQADGRGTDAGGVQPIRLRQA